jgi:hypothetical protein
MVELVDGFRLKLIFTSNSAASKNDGHAKNGQKQLENNSLASLT